MITLRRASHRSIIYGRAYKLGALSDMQNHSEITPAFLVVPAYGAPQRLLIPVPVVVASDRALARPLALGQLVLRVLAHVVSIALPLVAGFAEVRVAPAEPLGDRTAVFALEFHKIVAVLGAVFNRHLTAVRTYQFGRIEPSGIFRLVHGLSTVLSPSEVGVLALIAFEVGINSHGILVGLLEVGRLWVF